MTTTAPITEHVLTLASGHQLRYATRGVDLPIAVVFVHGWPDSWRSFEPVLDALLPTTAAVSVSLRGFGGSDAPPDGYTPDDFAADIRELVDHLDVTSAVFVGHSMGIPSNQAWIESAVCRSDERSCTTRHVVADAVSQ